MYKKSWFIVSLIIVLLGTACGPAVRKASSVSTDMVIVYQRQGGLAGITQEWVVSPDGTITGPGEQELAADPDQTAQLFSLSTTQEILALKDSYVPKDNCCDKYVYSVTIVVGDEEKTIRTSDDVEQPEDLTELLTGIQQLISNAQEMSN